MNTEHPLAELFTEILLTIREAEDAQFLTTGLKFLLQAYFEPGSDANILLPKYERVMHMIRQASDQQHCDFINDVNELCKQTLLYRPAEQILDPRLSAPAEEHEYRPAPDRGTETEDYDDHASAIDEPVDATHEQLPPTQQPQQTSATQAYPARPSDKRNAAPSFATQPAKKKRTASPSSTTRSKKKADTVEYIRNIKGSDEWTEISLAMSQEYPVETLLVNRANVTSKLLMAEKKEGSKIKSERMFDEAEAHKFAHVFSNLCFGEAGRQEVQDFVSAYDPSRSETFDPGAATRLANYAKDTEAPKIFREFFAAFSVLAKAETIQKPVIAKIERILQSQTMLEKYRAVCQAVVNENSDVVEYIVKMQGQQQFDNLKIGARTQTAVGVGHATIGVDTLSSLTGIVKNALHSKMQFAKTMEVLLNKFGPAFALLIPQAAITIFKDAGQERLAAACDIILEECPFVELLTNKLDELLWQPYKRGASRLPISLERLQDDPDGRGFIELIDDAKDVEEQDSSADVAPAPLVVSQRRSRR